jgi:hypothetical protein
MFIWIVLYISSSFSSYCLSLLFVLVLLLVVRVVFGASSQAREGGNEGGREEGAGCLSLSLGTACVDSSPRNMKGRQWEGEREGRREGEEPSSSSSFFFVIRGWGCCLLGRYCYYYC